MMASWVGAEGEIEAFLLQAKADREIWKIVQDVVTDHGNLCDHPQDCACSMARLTRAAAEDRGREGETRWRA